MFRNQPERNECRQMNPVSEATEAMKPDISGNGSEGEDVVAFRRPRTGRVGLLLVIFAVVAGLVTYAMLSLFAAIPAIIVAVFASVTLNRGLDAWFSERIQSIVNRAVDVAQTYIQEKTDLARIDLAGIASDLEKNAELFEKDRRRQDTIPPPATGRLRGGEERQGAGHGAGPR